VERAPNDLEVLLGVSRDTRHQGAHLLELLAVRGERLDCLNEVADAQADTVGEVLSVLVV
jgi:hypothetical protein